MMMYKKGLMAPDMMISMGVVDAVDSKENEINTQRVLDEWNLGPDVPSEKPGDNTEYWAKMANAWNVEEEEARRRMCANCEYFDNTPERMEAMENVPFNEFDENAGGRGYCHKFEFICHNLRSCQAWERKCYYGDMD